MAAKHSQAYRDRHREAQLCLHCSRKRQPGKVLCKGCHKRNLASKGPGKCRTCGAVSAKLSRCDVCREKLRANYRFRVKNGGCVVCKDPATAGAFCFRHWLKNIGHPYGLNFKNGGLGMIEQLWTEQQGLCAVTGTELIPGHSASLDHLIPQSKGGPSTKENLRWVLLEINRAKMDLTHEQFVQMCRDVVAAADAKQSVAGTTTLRSIVGGK